MKFDEEHSHSFFCLNTQKLKHKFGEEYINGNADTRPKTGDLKVLLTVDSFRSKKLSQIAKLYCCDSLDY